MLPDTSNNGKQTMEVDGVRMKFSLASEEIEVNMHALHALLRLIAWQLGDYGYFTGSGQFYSQGNLFSDSKSLISEADITPRSKTVTDLSVVITGLTLPNNPAFNSLLAFFAPQLTNSYVNTGLTLPNNPAFNSLLVFFAPRLINSYLVTWIVQHPGKSFA